MQHDFYIQTPQLSFPLPKILIIIKCQSFSTVTKSSLFKKIREGERVVTAFQHKLYTINKKNAAK